MTGSMEVRHCSLDGKHRPHEWSKAGVVYKCPGRMLPKRSS